MYVGCAKGVRLCAWQFRFPVRNFPTIRIMKKTFVFGLDAEEQTIWLQKVYIDESWTHHTRIIFPGCFVFHHTVRQLTENVEIVNLCCRRGKRRNGRESERKLMRENSKKTPHTSCDLMRLRLGMAISISRWFVTITTNMSMAYEMKLLVGFSLPRKRKKNFNQSYSRTTDQQHSDFSTFLKEKNLRMDRLANESYAIRAWLMTAAKKRISPETTLLAGPIRYNEFYNIIQKKREI